MINFLTDLRDTTHIANITGSLAAADLHAWDRLNYRYIPEIQEFLDRYQHALQRVCINKDSFLKVNKPAYQKISSELAEKTWQFVLNHKNSQAGNYAATSLDRKRYEPQLIAYAEPIRNNFGDNPAVGGFFKEMQLVKPVFVGQEAAGFISLSLSERQINLSDFKENISCLTCGLPGARPVGGKIPTLSNFITGIEAKVVICWVSLLIGIGSAWQQAVTTDQPDWTQVSSQNRVDGVAERLYHLEYIPSIYY